MKNHSLKSGSNYHSLLMSVDIKDLKSLYRFLRNTDIVELEMDRDGEKLKIKRGVVGAPEAGQPVFAQAPPLQAQSEGVAGSVGEVEPAPEVKNEKMKTVTAPMVGTFYRAPSPEAGNFVEPGSIVKAGQSLCIIEAMKLMNEVESEYDGKVVSILVENGQPVEYGEPLFNIEV